MENSSYKNMDLLQQTWQLNKTAGNVNLPSQGNQPKKTKFGSILNDLSNFLSTATDTAVTVDGIINGRKDQSGGGQLTPQQQMALLQTQRSGAGSGNMKTLLLLGGVAVVGSGIMVALLKKKTK